MCYRVLPPAIYPPGNPNAGAFVSTRRSQRQHSRILSCSSVPSQCAVDLGHAAYCLPQGVNMPDLSAAEFTLLQGARTCL